MTGSRKSRSQKPKRAETSFPWRRVLGMGAIGVALVLLIVVIIAGTLNAPSGGIPEGTQEITVGEPLHVQGDIYGPNEVPAGGNHHPIWANCGFYDQTIEAENAVHSLEHGAVWITYRPDLDEAQIDTLRDLASPTEKILVSPVQQNDPIMATAWGYQLPLQSVDDPRLQQFIVEFAGSLSAPEPGGSCSGGIGTPAN